MFDTVSVNMSGDNNPAPLFRHIDADDDPEVTEIESLCMNCHEQVRKISIFKILKCF